MERTMIMTNVNFYNISRIGARIGLTMMFGAVALTGANAHPEMDSCGRDITSGKLAVVCQDGVLVDKLTTQSVSATDGPSQPLQDIPPARRFRYVDF
jgi:hypothetical protein